jgi:hypothetical protein
MSNLEQLAAFCNNQKSIVEAVTNFIIRFNEVYREEGQTEQKILTQCVQQIFRKYYYSALDLESLFTPANITNTLCERKFGCEWMAAPVLNVTVQGRKITQLDYRIIGFQAENHPMVKDWEQILYAAAAGIRMINPGIPFPEEYQLLQNGLTLPDRHYINILCLAALNAGYLECAKTGKNLIGKTTPSAAELFSLSNEEKLRRLIGAIVGVCSNTLTEIFPDFQLEFTVDQLMGYLKKPKNFENLMLSIFAGEGVDLQDINEFVLDEILTDILQTDELEQESIAKLYMLGRVLDIYFFTPFGYYLQLIQPVYPEVYDFRHELEELLSESDNFQEIRNRLFSGVAVYDLTALGEKLLIKGRKPRREIAFPRDCGDAEMLRIVRESLDYLEDDEVNLQDFLLKMVSPVKPALDRKPKSAKVIEFPVREKDKTAKSFISDIYVFKVKCFNKKRIWRQIEIKRNQSLADLHLAILDCYNLDLGHLYSFFMNNRFWDVHTEITHTAARRKKIGQLNLIPKQKFAYLYDFGDEYRFEVELVATLQERNRKVAYPREVKRNKPIIKMCDECKSSDRPIEWYCTIHDIYLCDQCAQTEKHQKCFLKKPIL